MTLVLNQLRGIISRQLSIGQLQIPRVFKKGKSHLGFSKKSPVNH